MNAVLKAIEYFDSHNMDFDESVADYMRNGYLYVSNETGDECFIMAKILENDELFVFFVLGNIKNLMSKIHFFPKTISFYRNNEGKKKIYDYEKFKNKVFGFKK